MKKIAGLIAVLVSLVVFLTFTYIAFSIHNSAYDLKAECMNNKTFFTVYKVDYTFTKPSINQLKQPQHIVLQGFTNIRCSTKNHKG